MWENTTNEAVLEAARDEIRKSWRETCELNKDHPQAAELFNPEKMPALARPVCRRRGDSARSAAARAGSLCQRPQPRRRAHQQGDDRDSAEVRRASRRSTRRREHRERPGLHRRGRARRVLPRTCAATAQWMRDEAQKRIGHLYPPVEITAEMVKERPDLKPLVGQKLTVIAWLWARTVKSPNPAFSPRRCAARLHLHPLQQGRQRSLRRASHRRRRLPLHGEGRQAAQRRRRTAPRLGRGANFRCLMSGTPISARLHQDRRQSRADGREAYGDRRGRDTRACLSCHQRPNMKQIATKAQADWKPDVDDSSSKRSGFPRR